jgi:protein SCO1/2
MMRIVLLLALGLTAACGRTEPPPKEYQLKGQILSLQPEQKQVLVKHEDIPGFMAAMTMPYSVSEASLLEGKAPGDLITATLVVAETTAHLSAITKTGTAPLDMPETVPEVSALDMVKEGAPVPDAALVDEDGRARPLSSYRGKRLALTFIYTRCPDAEFCILMNQQFSALQRTIKSTPALADVQLLSVTFDPEFDTPAVLKEYVSTQRADPAVWHFATGTREEITRLAGRFGVTSTSNGTPVLIHNLGTAVIDAEGRLVKLYSTNQWKPADLIADLTAAAR